MNLEINKDYICEKIAGLVSSTDISERKMSHLIGKGDSYITDICNKRALPSMEAFLDICKYFKITPAEFFDNQIINPVIAREVAIECERLSGSDSKRLLELLKVMEPKHLESLLDLEKRIRQLGP